MNINLISKIQPMHQEIKSWMDYLHQYPELAMTEYKTSNFIAEKLKSFGYEVVEGIGKTGVVASMKIGENDKSIGLRADFDALPIQEINNLPYKSKVDGKSHLCGHDGHTAMLLGAAKYLAQTKNFNGTVRFIFQPGEETMQGALAMIKDGLFEKFPVDAIYGMHNMPKLEKGKFYFRQNETMAAVDNWEIKLTGKGGHGSTPELTIDPIVCGSALVLALQTIVSRQVSPWKNTVISVGAFIAGDAPNVIPSEAILRLSIRNIDETTRKMVLAQIRHITENQANTYNCQYEIKEQTPGAILTNTPKNTLWAAQVARSTFGEENIKTTSNAYMGSEDFSFMLQHKPGNYCMLGNGNTPMVHDPEYVFDQDILTLGTTYWIALAENYLR